MWVRYALPTLLTNSKEVLVKKLILVALLALTVVGCGKIGTRAEKAKLEYFGGDFTVEVYAPGVPVKTYEGKGYIEFEGNNKGAVIFKTKDGKFKRISAYGGVVDVTYR